jgi:hypothetical protein
MNDGVFNHFSLEVPGEEGRFLLKPFGPLFSETTILKGGSSPAMAFGSRPPFALAILQAEFIAAAGAAGNL